MPNRKNAMNWLSDYPQRNKILWWSLSLSGGAAMLLCLTQLSELSPTQIWQALCLLLVIGLIGRLAVVMPSSSGIMAPTDALIFLAAFALGTPVATLGAALNGFLTASYTERKKAECLYQAGTQAVATWLASTLMYAIIKQQTQMPWHEMTTQLPPVELFLTAAVAMIAVYFFSSTACASMWAT